MLKEFIFLDVDCVASSVPVKDRAQQGACTSSDTPTSLLMFNTEHFCPDLDYQQAIKAAIADPAQSLRSE
jgi:hypothetical protein